MSKLCAAVAAAMLAMIFLAAPQAQARCWWHNHHRYCSYRRPYPPYAYYPGPYYYPYYRPYYYRPAYVCFPIWPVCWWG
jgi:hypothetical protein